MKKRFHIVFDAIILVGLMVLIGSHVSAQRAAGMIDRWTLQEASGEFYYRRIACATGSDCMIVGYNSRQEGVVRATSNRGASWPTVHIEPLRPAKPFYQPFAFYDVAYPNIGLALVTCDSGRVMRSVNGGRTWEFIQLPSTDAITRIAMADEHSGFVSSHRALWRTTDGGTSWTDVQLPADVPPSVLAIASPQSGSLVVRVGDVALGRFTLRSLDEGRSWQVGPDPEFGYNIAFVDPDTGWACGTGNPTSTGGNDIIYKTTDGGMSWFVVLDSAIAPAYGLSAIDFLNAKLGIAVGSVAKILKTTDGGETWRQLNSGLGLNNVQMFCDVDYAGNEDAYAITTLGHVFHNDILPSQAHSPVMAAKDPVHQTASVVVASSSHETLYIPIRHSGDVTVDIHDLRGRRVVRAFEGWTNPGLLDCEVNLASYAPGLYIVRIVYPDRLGVIRLLIR